MTYRAVEILQSAAYILCEDTRHSGILLKAYSIDRPTKSFHKFNEASREAAVLQDLKEGLDIAVISDAGTPGIADPAARLVRQARDAGLEVQSIPGACAAVCALTCSGLPTEPFQFLGFAPKQSAALQAFLVDLLHYRGTSVVYESPKRVGKFLTKLAELAPDREVAVARELTKRFEELDLGIAGDLAGRWADREVKGELVLLIGGKTADEDFSSLSPVEHVQKIEAVYGVSKKEAMKIAARERGMSKRDLYQQLLEDE